ncbi:MAG TPA: PAS domain-containing protein [Ghiorsea sp.]|nr:PAS domain-containing protein [Ghiorsea sp.]HIP07707.1 PAS domain-containing protein [Mariprofundaceae bacterium]
MRNNQPVNNIEHRMKPDDILVSKTDLKGKLTYANEAFCKISGMTEEELIGQPHNVVRHPDMPPEAFADLWATVKAGKPWTGYVKNRSADGGFYWVKACVAPEFDDGGRSIGYISVRTCPTKSEISKIEALYADVNADRAKLPSTLKFSFIRSLKIKTKLIAVSILSAITMLGLLWLVYGDLSQSINEDEKHLKGLEYVMGVRHVLEYISEHRGLSNAALHGAKNLNAQLNQSKQEVGEALEELQMVESKYGKGLRLQGMVKAIEHEWSLLSRSWKSMSVEESFEKHTHIVQSLVKLSLKASENTGFWLPITWLNPWLLAR